jgi:DNA invertase Pin-like site-specific DNA recombinase
VKTAIYARVSTVDKDQNPEVQLEQLRLYASQQGWEVYSEYVDEASAADLSRRLSWTKLMKDASLRRFQVLLVWKLDRAFRSVVHATNTLNILRAYGVGFKSYMEPAMDTTSPYGEFIFHIMAAVAELERQQTRQRVIAGVEHAKRHGTRSGRPIGRTAFNITSEAICKALRDTVGKDGAMNYSEAARVLSRRCGKTISPAFVWMRLSREAVAQGVGREDLIKNIAGAI